MPPGHTPAPKVAHPATPPVLPQELQDLLASLARRLRDLESFQVPQLATCRGPLSLQEQFANDVRREMVGARRDLEELKLQVDDLDKAKDRAAGMEQVRAVQARIESVTQLYRNAVLSSRHLIETANNVSAREDLFKSASKARPTTADTPVNADDALMSATSDVTEGLRRTLQIMQQELDRSLVSNEILESSTATMQLTASQYSTFSTLLTTSKALITSLERADILDRLILLFALIFFGLCCAWVLKRRVVDKGIRVAAAVGKVVGVGGGGAAVKEELKRSVEEVLQVTSVVVASATSVLGAMKSKTVVKQKQGRKGKSFGKQKVEQERKGVERIVDFEEVQPDLAAPVETGAVKEEVPAVKVEDVEDVEDVAVERPKAEAEEVEMVDIEVEGTVVGSSAVAAETPIVKEEAASDILPSGTEAAPFVDIEAAIGVEETVAGSIPDPVAETPIVEEETPSAIPPPKAEATPTVEIVEETPPASIPLPEVDERPPSLSSSPTPIPDPSPILATTSESSPLPPVVIEEETASLPLPDPTSITAEESTLEELEIAPDPVVAALQDDSTASTLVEESSVVVDVPQIEKEEEGWAPGEGQDASEPEYSELQFEDEEVDLGDQDEVVEHARDEL